MSLWYPHIDFPDNLHEGMLALHLRWADKQHFCWTFEACWAREQQADARSPIVVTTLIHQEPRARVVVADFVCADKDVLVREFQVSELTAGTSATLMQYFHFGLGEILEKNSLRYVPNLQAWVQHRQGICIVVGGTAPDGFQCGKATAGAWSDAKADMGDGVLQGNIQDIGNVNLALAWNIPGKAKVKPVRLVLACGTSEQQATRVFKSVGKMSTARQMEKTRHHWEALPRNEPDWHQGQEQTAEAYRRAATTLHLLRDRGTGAFIAAPEFDPHFEQSGGYGYCWPRDSNEALAALQMCGADLACEPFFRWCQKTQSPNGRWEQRYWLAGHVAPTWCLLDNSEQVDQTASVLIALYRWLSSLPSHERQVKRRRFAKMANKATECLLRSVAQTGLHAVGTDLWETFRGSFAYSNAAIYRALAVASQDADEHGEHERSARVAQGTQRVKQAVLERLWLRDGFARGLREDGMLDRAVDSSVLGLVEPFGLLDLSDPAERGMAVAAVLKVIDRLGVTVLGGPAILRFEGDNYMGGIAGGVNTSWLARVLFRLALAFSEAGDTADGEDAKMAGAFLEQAERYLHTCLYHRAGVGLFPELIGTGPYLSHWATPHLWASASFIQACFLLAQARAAVEKMRGQPASRQRGQG